MADSPVGGKVIPFRRPERKSRNQQPVPASPAASRLPHANLLQTLHPRVLAVLVLRDGKWEVFERQDRGDTRPSILDSVSLPDLMQILAKSAAVPALESRGREGLPGAPAERITLSPWSGFDLALLLREGTPVYGLWLLPDTSIYVAEEVLPVVAAYFDQETGIEGS